LPSSGFFHSGFGHLLESLAPATGAAYVRHRVPDR